jgi:hypothetical protein
MVQGDSQFTTAKNLSALLECRVSSKHLKHASSYHQNNATGHLVKVSSFLLKVISPTNPFLDIRVSENFAQCGKNVN